jgi:hypothetical protein
LGLAKLRTTAGSDVILPLTELGVELRDPKRVDELLQVGTDLTVGLHSDRHPKLVPHGSAGFDDRFTWHRPHAPRPVNVIGAVAVTAIVGVVAFAWWRARTT